MRNILIALAIMIGGCASAQFDYSYWHSSTEYDSAGRCKTLEDCRPPSVTHKSKGVFSSAEEVVAVATADAVATNSRANLINARAHAEYMASYGGPFGGAAYGGAGGGIPVQGVGMLHVNQPDGVPITRQIKMRNQSGGYLRFALNGVPLPGYVPPGDTVYLVNSHPIRARVDWCVHESAGGAINGRGRTRLKARRDEPRSYRVTRFHVQSSTHCRF